MNIVYFNLCMLLMLIIVKALKEKHCFENKKRVRKDINMDPTMHPVKQRNVIYFSGHEVLRYDNFIFDLKEFTIDIFMKIEGGQYNNASILKIYNHCSVIDKTSLVIGLKEGSKKKDLRFFFDLQTESSNFKTTLLSHTKVEIEKWFHIVAMYNSTTMQFFLNQAKVDVSNKQSGYFISKLFHNCISIEIAGDSFTSSTFRGYIYRLQIWNSSKSHRDIANDIILNKQESRDSHHLLLSEYFENVSSTANKPKYYSVTGLLPTFPATSIPNDKHDVKAEIPECGITVCDNPEIINSYIKNENILVKMKKVKYRFIILSDDNGEDPLFTKLEIKKIHKNVNRIFSEHNITFKLHLHYIRNSTLRKKTVISYCYGHCEGKTVLSECNVKNKPSQCNNDCTREKIGDKKCNPECNKPSQNFNTDRYNFYNFKWDGGDCCNSNYSNIEETCYDINSPYRAFITDVELKEAIGLDNKIFLNIYPVKTKLNEVGKATFPWVPDVYTKYGGLIISANSLKIGLISELIHELGHIFGLWHVHKGVSEVPCDDKCTESFPSMTHGDLCADTNPSPENLRCKEFLIHQYCGFKNYTKLPFKNFMSYSSGKSFNICCLMDL